jgi:hypothetical protein
VKKILKKLDLEDILEKEINLWSQKSKINSTNTIIDDLKMSDVQSKNLNNILTSKISETIQNIKIKKTKRLLYISNSQERNKKT